MSSKFFCKAFEFKVDDFQGTEFDNIPPSTVIFKRDVFCKKININGLDIFGGLLVASPNNSNIYKVDQDTIIEVDVPDQKDFSFFALRLDSCKGLYLHYHNGISSAKFFSTLKKMWAEETNRYMNEANCELLLRQEDLKRTLANFRQLTEVQFSTVDFNNSVLTLGQNISNNTKNASVTLGVNVSSSQILTFVNSILNIAKFNTKNKRTGNIKGVDKDNNRIELPLDMIFNDYKIFDKVKIDDFSTSEFDKVPIFNNIIDMVCKESFFK